MKQLSKIVVLGEKGRRLKFSKLNETALINWVYRLLHLLE